MRFIFFIAAFLLGHTLFAQPKTKSTLSGVVTDANTKEPLAGTSVQMEDAKIGAVADAQGKFVLRNVPAGHHLIEVSHAGYANWVDHLDISGDRDLTITLAPSIIENQGVTVTGVSSATSIRKSPVPVTILRRTDLLQTASTNIVDALTRQPGVSQVSTGPAVSKPVIRGLGYNRVVVVNDGVRQEGQQWGDEHGLEMDDASINKAEILKGPASLMYGSDALAGVINLITNVPVQEGIIKGSVLSNYQTNNGMYMLHGNVAGNQKGFNWNVYGTLKSAGNYSNKYDGTVVNSGFNERNFGGYIGLNKAWGYSHLIVSSYNQKLGIIEGIRDSANGKFLVYSGTPYQHVATEKELDSRDLTVPYQHVQHFKIVSDNSLNAGKSRFKINVAYQDNQRREFGDVAAPATPDAYFNLATTTYTVHWQLPEMNHWRTTLGVNGMNQQNKNEAEEVIIPDYSLNDIGTFFFAQGLFPKYTLSGGIRYDNRSINSKQLMEGSNIKFQAFEKHFSNFSGSAGISYEPTNEISLKANIAEGFRAPNMAELGSNGAHEGTNRYEYGSKNLNSERSFQLDGGIDLNSRHVSLNLSVFYNRINNFVFYSKLQNTQGEDSMVAVNGAPLMAFQFNQQDAQLAGVEATIDFHPHPLDWLHFENRFSYVRGTFTEPVEGVKNLPLIPAPRWVSELRGNFKKTGKNLKNLYAQIEVDHSFDQNNPFTAFNTETATPGYTLFNAGLGSDLVKKDKTILSIYLSANNLTDVAYQNHLSRLKYTDINYVTGRQGVFNMGRNFSIKVEVPFSFNTK